jgi:hypothetical protein
VGTGRWRDPDEDLPRTSRPRHAEHYTGLRKPLDPAEFSGSLREEMTAAPGQPALPATAPKAASSRRRQRAAVLTWHPPGSFQSWRPRLGAFKINYLAAGRTVLTNDPGAAGLHHLPQCRDRRPP